MRLSLIILIGISLACLQGACGQELAVKHDLPAADAQKESLGLIAARYRAQFDSARTKQQRIDVARELLKQGTTTADDPTGRFVLFRVARDIAAQAGGFETSMSAVDLIAEHYRVDSLAMKAKATELVVKATASKTASRDVVAGINKLIDRALFADRFDVAEQFGRSAMVAARKTRDATVVKQVTLRDLEVATIRKQYESVEAALQVAKEKPNDPAANLTIGKYECFVKGDWQGGLDFLSHGNDATLKSLAMMEAKNPSGVEDQVALADGWWKAAQTQQGIAGHNIRLRAGHWYRQALPRLADSAKAEAEKRLASLTAANNRGEWADVLSAVDVNHGKVMTADSPDYVQGGWRWKKKVLSKKMLIGEAEHRTWMPLTCETTDPFEIKLSLTPAAGKAAGLALSVPIGDRRLLFILRSGDHRATRLRNAEKHIDIPLKFTPGRVHRIHLRVESLQPEVTFSIQIDQEKPTRWTGKPEDVAPETGPDAKDRQGKFAVEIFRSRTAIHSIHFRELSDR